MTDHRIDLTGHQLPRVLDGDLETCSSSRCRTKSRHDGSSRTIRTETLRDTPPEVASTPILIDVLPSEHHVSRGPRQHLATARRRAALRASARHQRLDIYLQFDRPLDEQELSAIRELVRPPGEGRAGRVDIAGVREFYGQPTR